VGWYQSLSRAAKFSIWMRENSAFGTVTSVRSRLRMRVERRPISSMVPTRSPNRQKSPTDTGWSARIETLPNRFSTVRWAASATAMFPPASSRRSATSVERFTSRHRNHVTATISSAPRAPRSSSWAVAVRPRGRLPR
jgi:hypothetical protein